MLCTVIHSESRCRLGRLSVLVGTEIGRHRVMLNSLVQHQSEQTSSVGHSSPDITLLFKKLVQFVPLWTKTIILIFPQASRADKISSRSYTQKLFLYLIGQNKMWDFHFVSNLKEISKVLSIKTKATVMKVDLPLGLAPSPLLLS